MLSGDAGELELLEADTHKHRQKRCTCPVVVSRPFQAQVTDMPLRPHALQAWAQPCW